MVKQIIDLPDGWTCIQCGDEYLKDTDGQLVDSYIEGTLCKKCNTPKNLKTEYFSESKQDWIDVETMSDIHVRRAFVKMLKKQPTYEVIKEELRCTELKLEKIKEVFKWG